MRNIVATNKASRSDADQRQDFFQGLLQLQKKFSKNIYLMNPVDNKVSSINTFYF